MTITPTRKKLDVYGDVIFGALVLVVFSEFLFADRIDGEPWQVVVAFVLGGIYAVVGILGGDCLGPEQSWRRLLYFPILCGTATAYLLITPLRGFPGLLVMPAVSIAVFELRWRWAVPVILELYAATIASVVVPYGTRYMFQAMTNYGIALAFTVLFSVVAANAIAARERAEKLSAELANANEQLRRYAAQAEELATTRERNRLAREIHDGLGHYLTTINIQVEAARATFDTQPAQAAAALANAARLSREALDDVRRSVGSLRADTPRPPLREALEQVAANLGLRTTIRIEGAPRALPPAVEHALYRSAQEGLTNVCKHAAAHEAEVTLDYRAAERVQLSIADRGRGRAAEQPETGFGLRGVRERVALLGGQVRAANRSGGGFELHLELPA